MKGQRPKKKAAGAARKKRKKAKRPNPALKLPKFGAPPGWLGPIGKEVWNEFYPLLSVLGVALKTDLPLLARYCDTTERYRNCSKVLNQGGEVWLQVEEKGTAKAREVVRVQSQVATRLLQKLLDMEQHLGMTPATRNRVASAREDITAPLPGAKRDGLQDYAGTL